MAEGGGRAEGLSRPRSLMVMITEDENGVVGGGNVVEAWLAPETVPAGCFIRDAPVPILWSELCGTPGADHSPAGCLWAPIRGFPPTLAGPALAQPSSWPGIPECSGGRPGLAEKRFGCCGPGAIFTVPSTCDIGCPERPRAGSGGARLCL